MTVSDVWDRTRIQLSFAPIRRAPARVHVTCPGCCSAVVSTRKQARLLRRVGGAAGVHPSASSEGLAVAMETKHRLCFGVRQTCSLGPSHTQPFVWSLLRAGCVGRPGRAGSWPMVIAGGHAPGALARQAFTGADLHPQQRKQH